MRTRRLLPALVAGLALIAGCDSAEPSRTPPAALAAAAFSFDGTFPQATNAHGAGMEHWANGAARVGVVSLVVGAHLVVPAAATHAATQVQPVVEDGVWVWQNTVRVHATDVTVRLEGAPRGQQVDWRMELSSNGPLAGEHYDRFTLYTGTTALDGRTGSWQLHYRIGGVRTQVLTADFAVRGAADREVTYRVPDSNPDAEARGSSVRYAADGAARLFDWREPQAGRTHVVAWSEATRAGSVTAWNYNDGARACWDGSLQNTACTP